MKITVKKDVAIAALRKARDQRVKDVDKANAEIPAVFEREKAAEIANLEKLLAELRKWNGNGPRSHERRVDSFYFPTWEVPKKPDTRCFEEAIALLEIATEAEIIFDTDRDKLGIAEALRRAVRKS